MEKILGALSLRCFFCIIYFHKNTGIEVLQFFHELLRALIQGFLEFILGFTASLYPSSEVFDEIPD